MALVEIILTFLIGDSLTHEWLSGELWAAVRQANHKATHKAWRQYLLGGSLAVRCPLTGEEREPGTSDEEESGALPNTMNFVNPLRKLSLSLHDPYDPFEMVIDMLGRPP